MIEKEDAQPSEAICHVNVGHVLGGYNYKVVVRLRVHTFLYEMMSRLIVK